MRYVMSDIHGDFQNFYGMLVKINFSAGDTLYILGDAVDKGRDNLCVLDFIRNADNICLIKGNHEYLCERYLKGTVSAELWDECGGADTRAETDRLSEEKKKELLCFLQGLPLYMTVEVRGEEYFLTHSGYDADHAVIDPQTGLVNIRASADEAAEADQERYLFSNDIHYIPANLRFDKKIIVGHYPVIFLAEHEKAEIYHCLRYTDIDTGNERRRQGGRLACLRLEDGKEFYV